MKVWSSDWFLIWTSLQQPEICSHLTSVRKEASSHRVASEIRLNKPSQNLGIRPASPWHSRNKTQFSAFCMFTQSRDRNMRGEWCFFVWKPDCPDHTESTKVSSESLCIIYHINNGTYSGCCCLDYNKQLFKAKTSVWTQSYNTEQVCMHTVFPLSCLHGK